MMNLQEQLERAKMAGVENWIDPNTQSKGWYTCLLTGKKMRGQQAQDQITRQEVLVSEWTREINSMKDSMDGEAEIQAEIEKPKKIVGVDVMVEFKGETLTVKSTPTLVAHQMTGDTKKIKTTLINCVDCGTQREIKVQDIFQVKRCPHCQAEHRKAMRRANYKAKKEAEREAKEAQAQVEEPKVERKEEGEAPSTQQTIEKAQQGTLFED